MPTYVYECKECAQQTELVQKVSDPPLEKCPSCDGSVRKVLFPVGIVFKGSGFYVNDYKAKEDKSRKSKSESSESSSSTGDSSPKPAEAKTESKTESKTT